MPCDVCKNANHDLLHDWITQHPFVRTGDFKQRSADILRKVTDDDCGEMVAAMLGVYQNHADLCDFCNEQRFGVVPLRIHLHEHLVVNAHMDCIGCALCHRADAGIPVVLSSDPAHHWQFVHGRCADERQAAQRGFSSHADTLRAVTTLLACSRKGNFRLVNLAMQAFCDQTDESASEFAEDTLQEAENEGDDKDDENEGDAENEADSKNAENESKIESKEDLQDLVQEVFEATKRTLRSKINAMMHMQNNAPDDATKAYANGELQNLLAQCRSALWCDFCNGVRMGQDIAHGSFFGVAVKYHYDCMPCSICYKARAGRALVRTAYGHAHSQCVQNCTTDMEQDAAYCPEANCWQHTPCLVHVAQEKQRLCCIQ